MSPGGPAPGASCTAGPGSGASKDVPVHFLSSDATSGCRERLTAGAGLSVAVESGFLRPAEEERPAGRVPPSEGGDTLALSCRSEMAGSCPAERCSGHGEIRGRARSPVTGRRGETDRCRGHVCPRQRGRELGLPGRTRATVCPWNASRGRESLRGPQATRERVGPSLPRGPPASGDGREGELHAGSPGKSAEAGPFRLLPSFCRVEVTPASISSSPRASHGGD